jgi:hypothetical protein
MSPNPERAPRATRVAPGPFVAVAIVAVAVCSTAAFMIGRSPPATTTSITSRPTPNVVLAMRDLSRLETATFHMEKVIELTDEQSRLFGLVQAQDRILLVAVGDVVAGVDLSKISDSDVVVDDSGGVRVVLPPPEVLSSAIDERLTHVYGRSTDLLATRKEELEGLARKEAQQQIERGARDGGILERARTSAERTVRALLASLGFRQVTVEWKG